jgi:hypothetical protein
VPGGGARMPTASGLPVARRDAALVQARRAATSTSFSLCCDDDQDAVGERLRPEHLCPGLVAAEDEQHAEADLRVAKLARRQLLAADDVYLPGPGTFLRMATEPSVLPGHRGQLERRPGLVLVQEPGDRGGEVIVLGFQPVQPGHLAGSFQVLTQTSIR